MIRRLLLALGVLGLSIAPSVAQSPTLDMGAVTTSAPSYVAGTNRPLSLDTSGNVRINCILGCSAGSGTGANNADGVASVGTGLGSSVGYGYLYNGTTWDRQPGSAAGGATANVKQFNGNTVSLNTGAVDAGTLRVTLGTGVNAPVNIAQIAGATAATGNGTAAGALRVALPTDGTGVVGLAAATTGGCTPYHLAGGTAATTNSTSVKGAAGTLCHLVAMNTTATLAYLRIYNLAAAPTCSSATGAVHTYPIPASTSGAGFVIPIPPFGEAYGTGIGFCVTGGGTDTDNTATVTGIYIEGSYK